MASCAEQAFRDADRRARHCCRGHPARSRRVADNPYRTARHCHLAGDGRAHFRCGRSAGAETYSRRPPQAGSVRCRPLGLAPHRSARLDRHYGHRAVPARRRTAQLGDERRRFQQHLLQQRDPFRPRCGSRTVRKSGASTSGAAGPGDGAGATDRGRPRPAFTRSCLLNRYLDADFGGDLHPGWRCGGLRDSEAQSSPGRCLERARVAPSPHLVYRGPSCAVGLFQRDRSAADHPFCLVGVSRITALPCCSAGRALRHHHPGSCHLGSPGARARSAGNRDPRQGLEAHPFTPGAFGGRTSARRRTGFGLGGDSHRANVPQARGCARDSRPRVSVGVAIAAVSTRRACCAVVLRGADNIAADSARYGRDRLRYNRGRRDAALP